MNPDGASQYLLTTFVNKLYTTVNCVVDLFADGVDGIYAGVIFSPIFYDSKSMIFLLYCTLAHQKIVYVTVWNTQISSYFIHSEIFLTWVLFFLKTLKGFHTKPKKKFKLECLFIFSGGNCTLNLREAF